MILPTMHHCAVNLAAIFHGLDFSIRIMLIYSICDFIHCCQVRGIFLIECGTLPAIILSHVTLFSFTYIPHIRYIQMLNDIVGLLIYLE